MILEGDCVEQMRNLDAESIDAVVCDPPYGIGFMGKVWDGAAIADAVRADEPADHTKSRGRSGSMHAGEYDLPPKGNRGFQAWCEEWAQGALRVLKPGGHLLAFGGPRTYHRLACAIEDTGFEIRDSVIWLYGTGFPKSHNVSKTIDKAAGAATSEGEQWNGWGTALKPAHEPIVVARKPLAGTVAANVLEHGTGALNIDGCRIGFQSDADEREDNRDWNPIGRWPANVALSPEAADELDRQSGELASGNHPANRSSRPDEKVYGSGWSSGTEGERIPTDTGGASRFFYVAKASRAERNAGLNGFDERLPDNAIDRATQREGLESASGRGSLTKPMANVHPTVKPIDLMRWLVRLVTPPGGTILDPFLGSGTTGIAAVLEGFDFIGIEREAEYRKIAEARLKWWAQFPTGTDTRAVLKPNRRAAREHEQTSLLNDGA